MSSYNLLDQPVFFASYEDGTTVEIGILEALSGAQRIVRLTGSSPLQEFLFMRILLAILYRSLKPRDKEEWYEIWKSGIPYDIVASYLEEHRERFDLLHPETPFFQIVGAKYESTGKAREPSTISLMVDQQPTSSGGEEFLFSTYTTKGSKRLSFSEATRKLIELQAYNTASKKSVIVGDPRTNKRSYAQPGWAGNLTGIVLLGRNLEQTLLLNLVPFDQFSSINMDADLPVWERPQQSPAPEGLYGDMDLSRNPTGPSDLFTYQISRVSLVYDDHGVTDAIVGIGDRIFRYNMHPFESLASWKFIVRDKTKEEAYIPIKIGTSQTWRGLDALLAKDGTAKKGQLLSKNLSFFSEIEEYIEDDISGSVRLATYEVTYGNQDAIINSSSVGQISLPASVLASTTAALDTIIAAAKLAKDVAKAGRDLHVDILVSEGKERKPVKGTSAYDIASEDEEQLLLSLGSEFKKWVMKVTEENHLDMYTIWASHLNKTALVYGDDVAAHASNRAITGRNVGNKALNVFVAIHHFRGKVRKLTLTTEQTKEENDKS